MEFKPDFDVWKFYDNIERKGYAECRQCKKHVNNQGFYDLRRHLLKAHVIGSDVKMYFKFHEKMQLAQCRKCKQEVWHMRRNSLERHIEKYHNIKLHYFVNNIFRDEMVAGQNSIINDNEDEFIEEYLSETNENERMDYAETSAEESDDQDNEQTTSEDCQYERQHSAMTEEILDIRMDKKIFKSAVWGLMIDDGVAPSLFGSKNMQSLINPVCNAISLLEENEFKIDNQQSARIISSVANQLRQDFSHDLHCQLFSLKIDMDFKGPPKTYCISASYIHEARMQKRFLGVIDLGDDAQLTGQHIKRFLSKFKIDPNQIIYACWDDTKSKYNTIVRNSEYLKEIENFEHRPTIYFNDIKIERYSGVLAQLCLLDVLKNPEIFVRFSHCRNFVKYVSNEANGLVKVLKQKELSVPQLDSPWKWGSTYKMMDELREARQILSTEVYPKMELVEDQFDISEEFWYFVDGFCESLGPIQKSINIFYTDEINFGDCYAQWLKSKMKIQKLVTKSIATIKFIDLLTTEALKCIKSRINDLFAIEAFKACLYLDPRFQHIFRTPKIPIPVKFLKKLWNRFQEYNPQVVNAAEGTSQEFDETKCETLIERIRLARKPINTNILLFWNHQRTTAYEAYCLSNICFAIPATQNYNQIRYTHIYKIQPNRKLPQSTMDDLATIRLNPHLVDDVSKWFAINEDNTNLDDDRAD